MAPGPDHHFISHRLVGWEHLGRIFLFEEGRIVESGVTCRSAGKKRALLPVLTRRQRLERDLEEGVFTHAAG